MDNTTSQISIFLVGATGYIGGSVLSLLLSHRRSSTFKITALVRSPEKARLLESQFGVTAVVGSHVDEGVLGSLSSEAQIVFSCADADHMGAVKAILGGMRKRFVDTGDAPILIHTSGTGVLRTEARGDFASEVIYDDLNAEQIESLPPTQLHRDVDLTILDADPEGYIRSYIVLPSTIYGIASTPLVDSGIQNSISIQIPRLIRASLSRGQGGVVGKGLSMWPDVHIDDVADLYILLFDTILSNPELVAHGHEGFYFGENGEHTWYEISKEIASALVDLGRGESKEPTPFTAEELIKYFGSEKMGYNYGTNSRCRGNRGRALGWKPQKTKEDMLQSIRAETEFLVSRGF